MGSDEHELDLIRRASAGDAEAFQQFILKHRRDILHYLQRRFPPDLGRYIDPQDVVQDVCFEIFRKMGSFHADDAGMGIRWILRIARNRLVDLTRQNNAVKRGSGEIVGEEVLCKDEAGIAELLQNLAVYERTPSQSAVVHEMALTVNRCLKQLPTEYQMALRYRYIDGLDVAVIAERMRRTTGAVMMLCHRGLKSLRDEMQSYSRFL